MRREVYKQDKEILIKIDFLVDVTHPKGGKIVCMCVEHNFINEKYYNRKIILFGLDHTLI